MTSNNVDKRIVALVDMDCFYVQVEQRRNPGLRGKPCVVVQYKKWKGGGIIAVGYEARAFGVTRQMRGDDAKERCPDVNLIYVPENRGKADLTHYRQAGAEVIKVLSEFSDCLERASIDEAFIDLSETVKRYKSKYTIDEVAMKLLKSSHVIGVSSPHDQAETEDAIRGSEEYGVLMRKLMDESNLNLAIGGIIANEMRDAVLEKTQFTCSAGIAQNKMLAKLIAGLHKPKQQTLLFQEDLNELFKAVKMKKVRHLGGKLGEALQQSFNVEMMSDLAGISTTELRQHFGEKTGDWLYWLGQGVDYEPVRPRQLPKSVGCCKNFRGREKLATTKDVSYWLNQLASEVCERLEQEIELNNRVPTHLCVNLTTNPGTHVSRSCGVSKIDAAQVTSDALKVINIFNKSNDPSKWDPPITLLGLSASKFVEHSSCSTKSIKSFFNENSTQSSLFQSSQSIDNTGSSEKKNSGERVTTESKNKVSNSLKRFFDAKPKRKTFFTESSTQSSLSQSNQCIESNGTSEERHPRERISSESKSALEIPMTAEQDPSQCNSNAESHVQTEKPNETMLNYDCPKQDSMSTFTAPKRKSSLDEFVSPPQQESPRCSSNSEKQFETEEQTEIRLDETIPNSECPKQGTMLKYFTDASSHKVSSANDSISADDFVICKKCGKRILAWELPEHNDFHFAQELQQNINRSMINKEKSRTSPPRKKVKRNTNITSFFK